MPAGFIGNISLIATSIFSGSTLQSAKTAVEHHGDRFRISYRVGYLNFAAVDCARGDDVFAMPPAHCHVRGAAVDFRWIFAGECTAAVASLSAIGVDYDLSAGEPAVGMGTAAYERTGRSLSGSGYCCPKDLREEPRERPFRSAFFYFLVRDVGLVLGR